MAAFFFDTSALVKYYHVEAGTSAVLEIFAQEDRKIRISTPGLLEAWSAFAAKVRSGEIDRNTAGILRARLMLDIAAGELEVFTLSREHLELAGRLIGRHSFSIRLRTLDALQLAVAVDLKSLTLMDYFVVADKALFEVARLEGLAALNPENTPST